MGLELSGMDELLTKLQEIGKNVEKVEDKALKRGAEVIRQAISDGSPRGIKNPQTWQYRAGKKYAVEHLKDNIVISKARNAGVRRYVKVGPEEHFFYARFLEVGTVHAKSQPFVEVSFLAKRREALDLIKETIMAEINNG